jgi:hypothetical protein
VKKKKSTKPYVQVLVTRDQRGNGKLLNGNKVSLEVRKNFWKWMVLVILLLYATSLETIKIITFMSCVFYHNNNKKNNNKR